MKKPRPPFPVALQQPANNGEGGGDRGEVWSVFLFTDQGGRYFIYRPPLRVIPAVGSATSDGIRVEEVEPVCRMGLKAYVAAQ